MTWALARPFQYIYVYISLTIYFLISCHYNTSWYFFPELFFKNYYSLYKWYICNSFIFFIQFAYILIWNPASFLIINIILNTLWIRKDRICKSGILKMSRISLGMNRRFPTMNLSTCGQFPPQGRLGHRSSCQLPRSNWVLMGHIAFHVLSVISWKLAKCHKETNGTMSQMFLMLLEKRRLPASCPLAAKTLSYTDPTPMGIRMQHPHLWCYKTYLWRYFHLQC